MKPYLLLVMLGATAFSLPPQDKAGHSGQNTANKISNAYWWWRLQTIWLTLHQKLGI